MNADNKAIPKSIYICYRDKNVPDGMIEGISLLNPGYSVDLFGDKECREFLGGEFGSDYADCFSYIKDGPIRADFWRVCMLYKKGGAYFDADVEHVLGIEDYLQRESTFLTSTSWASAGCGNGSMNPIVLMSRPGNPVLGMCSDWYVEAFRRNFTYDYWGWSITRKMHGAFCSLYGWSITNDQTELMRSGGDVYQFVNEDKRSGRRDEYFTHWRGEKILKNHRREYIESGHFRGFKPRQKPYEDNYFRVEVDDNPYPDTFDVSVSDGLIRVRRTDMDSGWGQDLMLKVHDKSKNKTLKIKVGPSSENIKSAEIVRWSVVSSKSRSPKMLLVLAGEPFRHGQHGRERDTPESFEPQKKASLSHMKFVHHVRESFGIDCDVVLASYATKYKKDILGWYGDKVVAHSFRAELVGLEPLIRDALSHVNLADYECALLTRVDIEFKPHLSSVFDPKSDKLKFPSLCWKHMAYLTAGPDDWVPRVSDTMVYVPKKLLRFVGKKFHLNHNAWLQYKNDGVPKEDMGFFLDTFHDSDSAKDYNPLFRMASRKDSPKWYSPNFRVAENLSPVRAIGYIGFPDWKPGVTDPYEDDSVVIALQYDEYVRPDRFSISLDPGSRNVTVKRLDKPTGWDMKVVLFVLDKVIGRRRELFVGKSSSNEKSISIDHVTNRWENERFLLSTKGGADTFHINMENGSVNVTRMDETGGWGQDLWVTVKDKSTGGRMRVRVGSSGDNTKSVEVDLSPSNFKSRKRERVAVCIVSPELSSPSSVSSKRPDYKAVAESVKKHIVSANAGSEFDFFLHSWDEGANADLEYVYRPIASIFEDLAMYADEIKSRCVEPEDFSGVSFALSIKRAIQLKERQERKGGFLYDKVVVYRSDVLLAKDMDLSDYDVESGVFFNGHYGSAWNYHFVMSSEDAVAFKALYDSPLRGNPYKRHGWARNFVERTMGRSVASDEIMPKDHQSVAMLEKQGHTPATR